jgi:hypothetical protein
MGGQLGKHHAGRRATRNTAKPGGGGSLQIAADRGTIRNLSARSVMVHGVATSECGPDGIRNLWPVLPIHGEVHRRAA